MEKAELSDADMVNEDTVLFYAYNIDEERTEITISYMKMILNEEIERINKSSEYINYDVD
jgi:hypothetical protein